MKHRARLTTLALVLMAGACGDAGKIAFLHERIGENDTEKPGSGGSAGKADSGVSGQGGSSGTGGASACSSTRTYASASCDRCLRGSCCSLVQQCDTGLACGRVDACRFDYCSTANGSEVESCVRSSCSAYGANAVETWMSYWQCMNEFCYPTCWE